MILFVNACVREGSRTKRLADVLLARRRGPVEEVRLHEIAFPVADANFLEKRDALIAAGSFDDPMFALARQFAAADEVVIAAPLWDLSFPASLKQYFEQINVTGITFPIRRRASPRPVPRGKAYVRHHRGRSLLPGGVRVRLREGHGRRLLRHPGRAADQRRRTGHRGRGRRGDPERRGGTRQAGGPVKGRDT